MRLNIPCAVAVGTLALTAVGCRAEVKLAPIFSDHMVLQRDQPLPVWGAATPGARVEVKLPGQSKSGVADAQGQWKVVLDPLQTGAALEIEITGEGKTRKLNDVSVGEVWLCSGQSNMERQVRYTNDKDETLAAAGDPQLRLFTASHDAAQKRDGVFSGTWTSATPASVIDFSAVAYHFGRELRRELNVPVGLVSDNIGGSTIQSWTPVEATRANPVTAPVLADDWTPWIKEHYAYDDQMEIWMKAAKETSAKGLPDPPRPQWPAIPFRWNKPGFLYQTMITPLIPFAMRGVIWYQGEANAPRAAQYRTAFPVMIEAWRKAWQKPDWPFLWVQLPNFKAVKPEPSESDWAELREAQAKTLSLPHTGMATTIELGEAGDIHPQNKTDVAHRLALVALAQVYQKDVESSGPVFDSQRIEGDKIVLSFQHAKGLKTNDGRAPQGFAVSGKDGVYHWSQATIEGETIVLRCAQVPAPVAVRYAWADNPVVNLVNAAGLPVTPFRTDNAPGITFVNGDLPADKA